MIHIIVFDTVPGSVSIIIPQASLAPAFPTPSPSDVRSSSPRIKRKIVMRSTEILKAQSRKKF